MSADELSDHTNHQQHHSFPSLSPSSSPLFSPFLPRKIKLQNDDSDKLCDFASFLVKMPIQQLVCVFVCHLTHSHLCSPQRNILLN